MPLSFDGFIHLLISLLTGEERQGSLAYVAESTLRIGEVYRFPGVTVEVPATSYIAFIDRQPSANWGHPARYVIASQQGGEVQSLEARLPPFQAVSSLRWRLVYQGPGVPDALVPDLSNIS